MNCKRLVLCASLLVLGGTNLVLAQNTRPRRVSEAPPPAEAPAPGDTSPARPEPTPEAAPKRRPGKGLPPTLKPRPAREKPMWAEAVLESDGLQIQTTAPAANVPLTPEKLQAAINTRLGAPYRFGSVGNGGFDCSGFVWSVFNEAGLSFQRDSARSYWASFETPQPGAEYNFGTLVFFNSLSHIGIVSADGAGFYHASTSKGVMYSAFDKYWTPRIDGFRRVPQQEAD